MTDEQIIKALREKGVGYREIAADRIESLQAQLSDARNELCQRCGRYHEAHKGACDGCRWRKNQNA